MQWRFHHKGSRNACKISCYANYINTKEVLVLWCIFSLPCRKDANININGSEWIIENNATIPLTSRSRWLALVHVTSTLPAAVTVVALTSGAENKSMFYTQRYIPLVSGGWVSMRVWIYKDPLYSVRLVFVKVSFFELVLFSKRKKNLELP